MITKISGAPLFSRDTTDRFVAIVERDLSESSQIIGFALSNDLVVTASRIANVTNCVIVQFKEGRLHTEHLYEIIGCEDQSNNGTILRVQGKINGIAQPLFKNIADDPALIAPGRQIIFLDPHLRVGTISSVDGMRVSYEGEDLPNRGGGILFDQETGTLIGLQGRRETFFQSIFPLMQRIDDLGLYTVQKGKTKWFGASRTPRDIELVTPTFSPSPSDREALIARSWQMNVSDQQIENFYHSLVGSQQPISPTIRKLLAVELSIPRTVIRWQTVNHLLQKVFLLVLLNSDGIISKSTSWKLSPRHWVKGQALPVRSVDTLRRAFFVDGFRKGLENAVLEPMKLGLLGFSIYHLVTLFQPIRHCAAVTHPHPSFLDFFTSWRSSNENTLQGLVRANFGSKELEKILLTFPLLWGVCNGLLRIGNVSNRNESFVRRADHLKRLKNSFWNNWMSQIPFHPANSSVAAMQKWLLWDGHLSSEKREEAAQLILGLRNKSGYLRILGLEAIAHLLHTAHVQDLVFIKKHEAILQEELEQLLSIKTQALDTLIEEASSKEKKAVLYTLVICFGV